MWFDAKIISLVSLFGVNDFRSLFCKMQFMVLISFWCIASFQLYVQRNAIFAAPIQSASNMQKKTAKEVEWVKTMWF